MNALAQSVQYIGRNTVDLDRAVQFYCDALGFHVDAAARDIMPAWTRLPGVCKAPPRVARLLLGAQQLELTEFADAAAYPRDSTSADLWFQHCAIVVGNIATECARVVQKGALPISRDGPETLPAATGGVAAFKFRDPDGHPLELIQFPAGTGDPAWQHAPTDPKRPALGIDHTAISVADIGRSIAFYARLGFRVAARGVNRGIEQVRLDDLDADVVDVVALEPARARTPHLELLGYRTPRGRDGPLPNARAVAADRLVLRMRDLGAAAGALADAGVDFAAATHPSGAVESVLLRDGDGHALVLV